MGKTLMRRQGVLLACCMAVCLSAADIGEVNRLRARVKQLRGRVAEQDALIARMEASRQGDLLAETGGVGRRGFLQLNSVFGSFNAFNALSNRAGNSEQDQLGDASAAKQSSRSHERQSAEKRKQQIRKRKPSDLQIDTQECTDALAYKATPANCDATTEKTGSTGVEQNFAHCSKGGLDCSKFGKQHEECPDSLARGSYFQISGIGSNATGKCVSFSDDSVVTTSVTRAINDKWAWSNGVGRIATKATIMRPAATQNIAVVAFKRVACTRDGRCHMIKRGYCIRCPMCMGSFGKCNKINEAPRRRKRSRGSMQKAECKKRCSNGQVRHLNGSTVSQVGTNEMSVSGGVSLPPASFSESTAFPKTDPHELAGFAQVCIGSGAHTVAFDPKCGAVRREFACSTEDQLAANAKLIVF